MKEIPDEVHRIADRECRNSIRYIGTLDGKEVYSLGKVDEDGIPMPTGMPHIVLWDGLKAELIVSQESLAILACCNKTI